MKSNNLLDWLIKPIPVYVHSDALVVKDAEEAFGKEEMEKMDVEEIDDRKEDKILIDLDAKEGNEEMEEKKSGDKKIEIVMVEKKNKEDYNFSNKKRKRESELKLFDPYAEDRWTEIMTGNKLSYIFFVSLLMNF